MKKRILIVDDKPANIEMLMEALGDEYAVMAATNGEKALELCARALKPDLVLLDIIMPGMDGYEVCKRLKADVKTKHIPVIFVTSIDEVSGEEIGLKAGAIDYIHKPIVPELVRMRVMNHLELKSYRDDLEKRVLEEMAKRIEQQEMLIQQSRMAAMGEMINNIAHQWRQPLNAVGLIFAKLQMSQEFGKLTEEILFDSVGKGEKLLQQMNQTIDDFRNFFRPDKIKKEFVLQDVIQETLKLSEAMFHSSKILLEQRLCASNTKMTGHPNELAQVLLNIMNNSKDAILENNIANAKITLTCECSEEICKVIIRDNGGGIPDEVLPKIFGPYFTTKDEGKGTGIGLYMSKQIIEKMGGNISACNVDGGAEFAIILPLQEIE